MKSITVQQLIDKLSELTAQQMARLIANGRPQLDENGKPKVDMATCGTCGRSWNDAMITDWTPAPSGRCPFEYWHPKPAEKKARLVKRIIIKVESNQSFRVTHTTYGTHQVVTSPGASVRVHETTNKANAEAVAGFLNAKLGSALEERE